MRDRYTPDQYDHPGTQKELEYLKDLLGDFGVNEDIDPKTALQRIFDRWTSFQADIISVAESVKKKAERGVPIGDILLEKAKTIHAFLFDGILENAGEYRKESDPNLGRVYFGGQKPQGRGMKYKGTPPKDIDAEVKNAFSFLDYMPSACKREIVKASMLFYLHFVRSHPFYDANGRIGRTVVSIYLYVHGYYIDWKEVNKKRNKFLDKINSCHDRCYSNNERMKERYRDYLVGFVMRKVESHQDFYDPDMVQSEE